MEFLRRDESAGYFNFLIETKFKSDPKIKFNLL